MKSINKMLAVVAVAAVSISAFSQSIVAKDDCTACKWLGDFMSKSMARGITDDMVVLKNGTAWFFFGKTAADAQWVVTQFEAFDKAVAAPDAKFCADCTVFANFAMNKATVQEVTKTKTGAIFTLVNSDKAVAAPFVKKITAMMAAEKAGAAEPTGGTKAVTVFLAKGDGITTCPVTGQPVNKNVSAVIFGKTIYFCCGNCPAKVQVNPEAYVKK